MRWPLINNVIRKNSIHNTFGMVRKYEDGKPKAHQGWDLSADVGTPCYAIADGNVVFVGDRGDFGLIVVHSFENKGTIFYAAYAHLDKSAVAPGDKICKEALVGTTGRSGNASNLSKDELHLHFETRHIALPSKGLAGRFSPVDIFKVCPLNTPILSPLGISSNRLPQKHGEMFA